MNITRSVKSPEAPQRGGPQASAPARVESPERLLQRLEWQVIRRLDGMLQGDYRSMFYGFGIDFADLREYQAEDDIRYIDWNVTARMDTPYVRQYMEEREITAWFLIDLSPSMDFGTTLTEKRAVLIDLVATLARLLTRHGNRVGAILYNGQETRVAAGQDKRRIERVIPAQSNRNHVLHLIHELQKLPRLPKADFTDLKPLLDAGLLTIKKRSLIFIISDFISAPGWERPLSLLHRRHEVLAVRLWDPREVDLPDIGPVWMEDAETGEQLYVDTHDPKFRKQFAEEVRKREAALTTTFHHVGVEPWSLSTADDLVKAIARFASVRKQYRQRRSEPAPQIAQGSSNRWR